MYLKEAELVTKEFVLLDSNYNLIPGGHGGFSHLNDGSTEHLERARRASKIGMERGLPKARDVFKKMLSDPIYQEKRRQNISEQQKEFHKRNPNHFAKDKNPMFGKTHSEFSRNKMSEKASGANGSQFGTTWITNGIENKKIKSIDTIPEGWYKGRILKQKLHNDP